MFYFRPKGMPYSSSQVACNIKIKLLQFTQNEIRFHMRNIIQFDTRNEMITRMLIYSFESLRNEI